jgi:Zn ribbon nucleic-acid-binding protein
MSEFLRHAPCPKCGSKDNLAVYSDGGSHCFGCGYHPKREISPYVHEHDAGRLENSAPSRLKRFVSELEKEYSEQAIQWAAHYALGVEQLLRANCLFSKQRQQLAFLWCDDSGNVILAQGRNFKADSKLKYITYGTPEDVLPIYYHRDGSRRTNRLVIVEDALSAIKISSLSDSMPCLSSDLSRTKLNRLARLYGAFTVWLDSDMFHKAQRIARRLELMGCEAKAVWTELDPKCYDLEAIDKVLKS